MQPRLKQVLTQRQTSHIVATSYVPAAVLIPVYHKQGEYHILFTKRTEIVKDHKGQISFPGGTYEAKDGTLLNTALRESTEEIGLAAEAVEVLGELDDYLTVGSGYIISPFVGVIPWPYPLKVDPIEVAKIVEVPISALLNKSYLRLGTDTLNDQVITAYFYHYQGEVIWGATARILNQFLDIWVEVMGNTGE